MPCWHKEDKAPFLHHIAVMCQLALGRVYSVQEQILWPWQPELSTSNPIAVPHCALVLLSFLCICTLKLRLDLLQEGQLCSSVTALATLASLDHSKMKAFLQCLVFVKLEKDGENGNLDQDRNIFFPCERPYAAGPHSSCDASILKEEEFWFQALYELWLVSAGNEQEPLLLVK